MSGLHGGIIYLVQPKELLGSDRYKVGFSSKGLSRLKSYHTGARYIFICDCRRAADAEKELKKRFRAKFTLAAGSEYFAGDLHQMKKIFLDVLEKYDNGDPPPIFTNTAKTIKPDLWKKYQEDEVCGGTGTLIWFTTEPDPPANYCCYLSTNGDELKVKKILVGETSPLREYFDRLTASNVISAKIKYNFNNEELQSAVDMHKFQGNVIGLDEEPAQLTRKEKLMAMFNMDNIINGKYRCRIVARGDRIITLYCAELRHNITICEHDGKWYEESYFRKNIIYTIHISDGVIQIASLEEKIYTGYIYSQDTTTITLLNPVNYQV